MAAFKSIASHLFNIKHNGKRYEIIFEEDAFELEPTIDPIQTKLSALTLVVGDTLTMKYDYSAGWEFSIELMSIIEMKQGSGTHYPYVSDGKGRGSLEDASPYELIGIIIEIDETGSIPKVFDYFSER